MDKSPSPHHLDSLNQEDKAASMAGEGEEETGQACPPTSLLDLPDELIAGIFQQAYLSLSPKKDSDAQGLLVPLAYTLVNKRIFRIAKPIFFKRLAGPADEDNQEKFLAGLMVHREVHTLVKALNVPYAFDFPLLQISTVSLLSNLASLILSFEEGDGFDVVPKRVTDVLKSLRHLFHLRIAFYTDFEDEAFSLDHDLPSLRNLDVECLELLKSLLSNGGGKLKYLSLRATQVGHIQIPWTSLKSLRLRAEAADDDSANELVASMLEASKHSIALERLLFEFSCSKPQKPSHPNRFNISHMRSILDVLQVSQLKRLEMRFSREFGDWSELEVKLPSVRTIVLRGTIHLNEGDNLTALFSFISFFPHLVSLHLHNFQFSSNDGHADTLSTLSAQARALQYPHLAAFLAIMRPTSLLSMRYRGAGEKREMRWIRRTSAEDFQAECWTLV